MTEARLQYADLSQANLNKTKLSFANLSETNLNDANLSEANLKETYLSYATLNRTDLTFARLDEANLSGADLRESINLTCEQVESARIDKKTKFPDYLQITWTYVGKHGANFHCKLSPPKELKNKKTRVFLHDSKLFNHV